MKKEMETVSNVEFLTFSIEEEIQDRLIGKNSASRRRLNNGMMLKDCSKEELVEIINSLTEDLYNASYCIKASAEMEQEEAEDLASAIEAELNQPTASN